MFFFVRNGENGKFYGKYAFPRYFSVDKPRAYQYTSKSVYFCAPAYIRIYGMPQARFGGTNVAQKAEKKIITKMDLAKLEEELTELRVVARKEIAQKIKDARDQGDLSENAEYDAAMDEQRDIESRIVELEDLLKNVEVVDEGEIDLETVSIGSKVTVLNLNNKKKSTFQIVGTTGANALLGKISNESPVGRELIGSKVGSEINIELPSGTVSYRVLEIHKPE